MNKQLLRTKVITTLLSEISMFTNCDFIVSSHLTIVLFHSTFSFYLLTLILSPYIAPLASSTSHFSLWAVSLKLQQTYFVIFLTRSIVTHIIFMPTSNNQSLYEGLATAILKYALPYCVISAIAAKQNENRNFKFKL